MVDQCAKWKILAKYQLTLRMHFKNVPNPARPAEEKTDKARTSSLIPSDPFKPVCCQYPTNLRVIPDVSLGERHSETVVVGGDAVATRRFLGIPPPLATWRTRRPPRYLLTRPDWRCHVQHMVGSAVARIARLGEKPRRVGRVMLESDP